MVFTKKIPTFAKYFYQRKNKMAKIKYKLNPETLSVEVHSVSHGRKIKRIILFFALSVVWAMGCIALYSYYFDTPKAVVLRKSNAEEVFKLELLHKQITTAGQVLQQLQQRDHNIYRSTLGLDEIPASIREAGFGGIDRYRHLEESMYADILMNCTKDLDKLMRKVYIQSISFDTIAQVALQVEQMVDCVPAIPPVAEPRLTSRFGVRSDPFSKQQTLHQGLDFGGLVGDAIFATGNGKVVEVVYSILRVGYGNHVMIDHGFGYKTHYAHLHAITVKKGDEVKRGQQIGTLGITGKTSGPHLHYEVLVRDKKVDPVKYFANDIAQEDLVNIMHYGNHSVEEDYE